MQQRRLIIALLACVLYPAFSSTAIAQSAIAGVVRDTTGAVLPGVTVEASSSALIEKARTTVTSEAGQYRLVDLRPGVYRVSFTLTGFNTVVREDVVLEANFTAPINVEMRIGSLEESVTVTGESPVVDVQSSSRRELVTQQQLEEIPTGRNFQLMANLVPAVSTGVFDVGGSSAMWTGGSLLVHGSLTVDSRTMIDGMAVDAMFGGGQCSCTYDNEAQTQEIAVQVSGGSAENQLSGVLVNRIPRTGGNRFSGDLVTLFGNDALQGQNLDDDLRARGLTTPAHLHRLYDVNFSLGGPIVRDKLWFFFSGRHWAYNNYVANAFYADGTQAVDDNDVKAYPLRLTAQLTRRDRVTALFDWASKNRGHRGLTATVAPEASFTQRSPAQHIAQAKWTSAMSSRLLLEAGYSQTYNAQKYGYQPEVEMATCFSGAAFCSPGTNYGDIAKQDTLLGTFWNAASSGPGVTAPSFQPSISHGTVASLSYVSGAHNLKVGLQNRSGWEKDQRFNVNGDLRQQYRNGVPFAAVIFNTPIDRRTDVNADFGVYVQDTWTMKRLTINPGFRYDYFNSEVPYQESPAGRFVPARTFERVPDVPNWHNVSPRFGASYDLFGNGKTAIKGTIGLYVQSQGPGFASTYNPVSFSTDTRTWNDLNRDDIAQENELGPTSNLLFGVRRNQNPDPDIERPSQWVADLGVQHELRRGLAVSVSYNERSFHNIIWTDNLAIAHSDYTLLTVPDPRGNGELLPVYNLDRAKLGLVNELDDNSASNTRVYRGVDVSFNLRLSNGGSFFGGTSTGHVIIGTCEVDDPNNLRFCDQGDYGIPFATSFKLAGNYPLPYGIRVGASFQSTPGSDRGITYQVTRTQVPTLTQTSVNVRLNEPGTLFNDRVNQVDLNLSRNFRINGNVDVRPEVSIFNLLNANPVTNVTNTWGPALDRVNAILDPRLVRMGLTIRF
jgi:hypothetical protein